MFGADDPQQLSAAYPDSSVSKEHLSALSLSRRSAVEAGEWAPDARVTSADGRITKPVNCRTGSPADKLVRGGVEDHPIAGCAGEDATGCRGLRA